MSYLSIILLAIALSVDACVVSFTYGLTFKHLRKWNCFLLAAFTGVFQALMPVIGYFLTNLVKVYISPYADLIVFLIFVYLGCKFISEAFEKKKEKHLCLDIICLFLVGIATSIDAFSAGITLSLYGNKIIKPALLIGMVTYLNSTIGFLLGAKLNKFETKYLEIFAGLILICMGIKALL